MLALCLVFLGAYGVVNLYNVLKHSPVNSLEDFLVPLLSSNYMEGVLHLDMPLYPCAYMAVITLFLMGTSVGLSAGSERKTTVLEKGTGVFAECGCSGMHGLLYEPSGVP